METATPGTTIHTVSLSAHSHQRGILPGVC